MDNQILFTSIGVVAGALITSLIAPYILQSTTRREAKAEALRKLMDVELTRWSDSPHETYRKNQIELKAAVLIAGGSRTIVDYYTRIAAVARSFSDLDADDHHFSGEGGIPTNIGECASDAASLLSQSLWFPYILRFIPRARLRGLKKKEDALKQKYKGKRGYSCWEVRII